MHRITGIINTITYQLSQCQKPKQEIKLFSNEIYLNKQHDI